MVGAVLPRLRRLERAVIGRRRLTVKDGWVWGIKNSVVEMLGPHGVVR